MSVPSAHRRLNYELRCRERPLVLGRSTCVMGVINVTSDSFSGDGIINGQQQVLQKALRQARSMVRSGAQIIDVGGESSRPGSFVMSAKDEAARVVPVIELLSQQTDAIISIDTYKPFVAKAALKAGASIVNVIKGTPIDDRLIKLVSDHQAVLVIMHMRGTSRTMQRKTSYADVVKDVIEELKKTVERCRRSGLNENSLVVDPGIGFAKTAEQNLELLARLREFNALGCPILVGTSRKSFIGKTLGLHSPSERIMGTAASVACAVLNGAHIVRVHDVSEMTQVVRMTDAIMNAVDQ